MRKRIISCLILTVLCLSLIVPDSIQAASYKTNIKKLVNEMQDYEYSLLTQLDTYSDFTDGKYEVKLTNATKAEIAAIVGFDYKDAKILSEDEYNEMWVEYAVPSSTIKTYSKMLFGKAVSYKKLEKGSVEESKGFYDAYLNPDGKAAIYSWEYETETDFDIKKTLVKKSGSTYTCTKDVFYGYWGERAMYPDLVTHRITYTLKKKKGSSFGYIITGMQIESLR